VNDKDRYEKFVNIVADACEKLNIQPPEAHKYLFILMKTMENKDE